MSVRIIASLALAIVLPLCSLTGTALAQSVTAPYSQDDVPLASLASQVEYTVDLSSLPTRPRLIAEATPDAAHADMELELQISNCTLDNPVAPGSTYFCPSPVSTPNTGPQSVSFDAFFCETATTIPAYPGETCRVTVRALDFGAAGAPANVDVVIRGETIVPSSTVSTELTTSIQNVSIAPTKDTTLYQSSTGSSNGQGESLWTSSGTGSNALQSLLAFDVPGNVPAGATILDAWIELQVLATSGATPTFRLFSVPRNPSVAWVEGSANAAGDESTPPAALNNAATWSHRQWSSTTPLGAWTTPGGDSVQPYLRNLTVTQTGLVVVASANLLQHVQALQTDTTSFDGMILVPLSGGVRFASDEHATAALRPRLVVRYFEPTVAETDNINTTTAEYFNEGQNFRWIYDLDNDHVLVTPVLGRCSWTPPGGFLINVPYEYQFNGDPSYAGLDCCTWQIDSSTGATGTGQAIFYINVDGNNPANQPLDTDLDGIKNLCDNCPTVPNGPLFGTCTSGPRTGSTCHSDQECNDFPCSLAQDDTDRDGDGNACVPEPGLGAMVASGLAALAALAKRRSTTPRR